MYTIIILLFSNGNDNNMPKVIPTHMLTIGMDYDLTADAIK